MNPWADLLAILYLRLISALTKAASKTIWAPPAGLSESPLTSNPVSG
jgi:hypothetical protein